MPRLLASRAWSVLALLGGITSVWAADVSWLQVACAAGLLIGIAQQLVLLGLSIHTRTLETFRVRLSAAIMLCAGVACWYLANSPRLPFLVVAGLLVVLGGLWWFCAALKDVDVVRLQARNLPGVPNKPVDPPRWPYGWGGPTMCAFLVLGFVAATLSLPAVVFSVLAVLAVAMLAVMRVAACALHPVPPACPRQASRVRPGTDDALQRACRIPHRFVVTFSGENRTTLHCRDHRRTRFPARGGEVHDACDLCA